MERKEDGSAISTFEKRTGNYFGDFVPMIYLPRFCDVAPDRPSCAHSTTRGE
jgi:hypothetical protein